MRKNAYFPYGGSRFDKIRGYTSLDGNGKAVFDITKKGNICTFKHNKTGKVRTYIKGKDI